MVNNVLIDCNILKEFVSELFKKINMPDKDAEWFAENPCNIKFTGSGFPWSMAGTHICRSNFVRCYESNA